MSYLHPAYNRLLPATARPQLVAFLQIVQRSVYASADGWTDLRQEAIARELGRSARSVQLYERICTDAGILIVEHGGRGNRRRLTMRSAKEALASNPSPRQTPIRQSRNALRDRPATDCGTVDNFRLLPRARVSLEDPLLISDPRPALPAERSSAPEAKPRPGPGTVAATAVLVTELGPRWAPKVAELVHELCALQGERQAIGYLDIVRERTAGTVQPYARAKGCIAMLNARLRKVRERGVRRTGAPTGPNFRA